MTPTQPLGAPPGYSELVRYLPKTPMRLRALGVTPNTLINWDKHRAKRFGRDQANRVLVLMRTCEALSAYFHSKEDVGEFLLSPQPYLSGRPYVEILRASRWTGSDALLLVVRTTMESTARVRAELDPVLNDAPLWDAMRAGLSDTALRRLEDGQGMTRRAREARGTADLLA